MHFDLETAAINAGISVQPQCHLKPHFQEAQNSFFLRLRPPPLCSAIKKDFTINVSVNPTVSNLLKTIPVH